MKYIVHDPEVMSTNPDQVERGVCSTFMSKSFLKPKMSCIKSYLLMSLIFLTNGIATCTAMVSD